MRAQEFLQEVGDQPSPYTANRRRKNSLFHSEVDGTWVDVQFATSDLNGTAHIVFAVNDYWDEPRSEEHTSELQSH